MDPTFWHQRWENNEIGFHGKETNPRLLKHFKNLPLESRARIFLPLCGKTLDIHWLLSRGHRVVGAELSQLAVDQLFADLGLEPKISNGGAVRLYSAENIDIFVGDIFDVSEDALGAVDGIYDRAALVALPESVRGRYSAHLMTLTGKAPQLLICFDYDQTLMDGPPFSVSGEEVLRHYGDHYDVTLLESETLPGGLKGRHTATEYVWLLKSR